MAQPQSQTLLGEFTAVLQTPSWWEGTPLPLPNNPTPQFWDVKTSDIPVLKIISVLVSIKFELNRFSISFYTVSELFSVLVSIKFFRNNFSSVSVSVFTSFQ